LSNLEKRKCAEAKEDRMSSKCENIEDLLMKEATSCMKRSEH